MKTTLSLLKFILLFCCLSTYSQVGINTTTPNNSSMLDITATNRGFLMPRVTTAQRNAIATPAEGLQVFDTTTKTFWWYANSAWKELDKSKWTNDATNTMVELTNLSNGTTARTTGTEFVIKDDGRVGIGTSTPAAKLTVNGDNISLISSPAGQSRYHLYNNGAVAEWFVGQKSGTNHDYIISKRVGAVESDYLTIKATNGYVGIATTAPTVPLHVNGSIFFNGTQRTDTQGTFLGWNDGNIAYTGGLGMTSMLNNRGTGPGGFIFATTSDNTNFQRFLDMDAQIGGVVTVNPYYDFDSSLDLLQVNGNMYVDTINAFDIYSYGGYFGPTIPDPVNEILYVDGTARVTDNLRCGIGTGSIGLTVNGSIYNSGTTVGTASGNYITWNNNTVQGAGGLGMTGFVNHRTTAPGGFVFSSTSNGTTFDEIMRMRASDGRVSINGAPLNQIFNVLSAGATTGAYTTTGWTHASDGRLKTNVKAVTNAMNLVKKLNGVYYNWKENPTNDRQMGFIAQDVLKVIPEVVVGTEGDISKGETLSMAYQNLVPLLVEAIKEQESTINTQQKQINDLTKKLEELTKIVKEKK